MCVHSFFFYLDSSLSNVWQRDFGASVFVFFFDISMIMLILVSRFLVCQLLVWCVGRVGVSRGLSRFLVCAFGVSPLSLRLNLMHK